MLYLGQASCPWKLRYNNHIKAFRNRSQRAHCELANHVWDLKEREKTFRIFWRVVSQETPYSKVSRRCKLCTREKIEIMRAKRKNPTRILNERVGILGPCLHRDKHLLGRVKTRVGNQVGGGSEGENPLEERS